MWYSVFVHIIYIGLIKNKFQPLLLFYKSRFFFIWNHENELPRWITLVVVQVFPERFIQTCSFLTKLINTVVTQKPFRLDTPLKFLFSQSSNHGLRHFTVSPFCTYAKFSEKLIFLTNLYVSAGKKC